MVSVCTTRKLWLSVLAIAFLAICAQGQSTISGTVTGSDGLSLIGVSITVEGTSTGTITDVDGNYSLKVPSGVTTLVFSYTGYKDEVVNINGRSTIDLVMVTDIEILDEVVVVGYGTQRKSDLTGSVTSLSSEQLNSQPITSLEQGLQGKVAGMLVTNNSSAPGGGISIKIRGVTSILNGSEPLYVIDGFPVTGQSQFSTSPGRGTDSSTGTDYTVNQNPLASLNPADIQSIEILKDASAAAIYGVRGANGVILITTKRGVKGAPKVSYHGYAGTQSVANRIELMNAQEYQDIFNTAAAAGGDPVVFTSAPPYDTDWQDLIFRSALIQNHQLSVNGGSEAVQYNISTSYFDQDGVIKGSDFERYSLRLNMDFNVSEKIKFGNSLNVSRSNNNAAETEGETTNGITSIAIRQSPILPVYLDDGTYSTHDDLPSTVPDAQGSLNPLAFINEFSDKNVLTRILGNVFGEYLITPDLRFRISVGADIENQDRHVYRSSLFNKTNPINSANVSSVNRLSLLNENTLNYSKSFGVSRLSILAGFTSQKETAEYRLTTARGFATDITSSYDLGGGSVVPEVDSRYAEFSILSFLGRINYNFDNRYLITVTGRRDGSSKFAEGGKWAFFPSIAGAWRISNESFMSDGTVVNNLKLRAGWGQVGNQELPTYRSLALLQSTPYNFGSGTTVNGFSPLRVPVPNLTWEISTQTNIGLDVSFLESRINFTADYYIKKTDDLLLEVQLPETSGILDPSVQNLGSMENVGWEFSFDGVVVHKKDFRWNLGFNISGNKNEVTSLGSESEVGSGDQSYELPRPTFAGDTPYSYVSVGQPLGVFFGYKTDGLYRSQAEADAGQALRPGVTPGMIKFVDVNGDGELTVDDRTIIGSPHPDFIYGFNTSFSYKAFELRVFFQGQKGGDVYNTMRGFNSGVTRGQNLLRERMDSWTPENPNAAYPVLNSNPPAVGGTANTASSDWFLEDASYLRMRELSLTYNLPNDFLGVLNGAIYLTGQNLLTITDYKGYNPDTNGRANVRGSFGWDVSSYPLAKTVLLGLKLNF
ncbi:MAG: SusC/RagA family TonB-linked outer membrane protein [Saprospiraceae bacterium]|nr:MAG: SusC/RagA family TonB-linked outer membrane protein [Saprospiraceae bacterium]